METPSSTSDISYQDIFEAVHDMILIIDRDGNILDINRRAEALLGYTQAELCRMNTFRDLYVADDVPKMQQIMDDSIAGKTCEYEVRYQAQDGSILYFEGSSVPRFSPDGTFLASIRCLHDITERKRMEEALAASEAKYRRVFDAAYDIIILLDEQGNVLDINKRAEQLLGYPQADLLKMNTFEHLYYPDDRPLMRGVIDDLVRGESREYEVRARDKDGKLLYLEGASAPYFSESGEFLSTICCVRDISERKLVEAKLRASEELHRVVLSSISDAVFITNESGDFTFICPNVETIFGYSVEEVQSLSNIAALLGTELGEALEWDHSHEIQNLEHRITDKSGGEHLLLVNIKQVSISEGTRLYTCRDITKHKQAEDRYRRALDSLMEGAEILDSNWHYVYANDAVSKHGRQPKDVLLRSSVMELYPGIENTALFAAMRTCMEDRIAQHIETEFVFPDGEKAWFELSMQPVPEGIFILSLEITERKHTERALQEREQQLRSIYDAVSDVVFYLAVEGGDNYRFLFVNEAFLAITGLNHSQVIGKRVNEVIPEPSLSLVLGKYNDAFREKKVVRWEETSNYPAGTVIGEVSVTPVFDNRGVCTHLVGVVHDISERKRMERNLRASEEQYRQLFEANPHPMFVADIETRRFLAVNEACIAKYGYSRDAFLSMKADDIRVPEERDDTVAAFERFSREQMTYALFGVRSHLKKDGTLLYSEVVVNRLKYDGKDTIFGVAYDLTDRLRAEEDLRRSEALFSNIFQSVPVAIGIHSSSDGRMMNVNPTLLTLSGYSADELIGLRYWEVPLWSRGNQIDQFNRAMQESGAVSNLELEWMTKDGKLHDMLVSAVQVDIRGEPCVLTIALDIGERKRTEQLRLEVYKEREILDLKERFISKMSHEFRTPLAVILSSKETLEHYFDRMTPEQRLEKLHNIENHARYIADLLDDVLLLGKSHAGKLQFNPGAVDIATFCQKLFDQIQLTDKGAHDYRFSAQGEVGVMQGDEHLLQHILINLLSNAVKYSPEGGQITLALSRVEDVIVLQVSDAGIGIPEQDQKHLFEPFYRASNTGKIKGTGLGLAIVKESVEAQGGTIGVESAPGKGTTFTIHLPVGSAS